MQTPAAGWIDFPENRAARGAAERVLGCVCAAGPRRAVNPLFLHGPPGCGKTHLVQDLIGSITRARPEVVVSVLPARELSPAGDSEEDATAWKQADLVVVEDVQHLPARAVEALVALLDRCLARQRQVIVTASAGPALLTKLPARLTSRLGQGLVVGVGLLGPDSRREYLARRSQARGLAVGPDVLAWLAAHTPGSARQLEGALTRVETMQLGLGRPAGLADVQAAFDTDALVRRPTLERIARQVGRFFQVDPDQLCSRRRSREVLLPRQVGMYLARQLTGLPLGQIGTYFGGRDHSTVLHACRKVERALGGDARLTGAVRQLRSDLA